MLVGEGAEGFEVADDAVAQFGVLQVEAGIVFLVVLEPDLGQFAAQDRSCTKAQDHGLDKALDGLPRTSGAALILDDTNERMFPIQVRPRFTWHGGESPSAVKKERKLFEF